LYFGVSQNYIEYFYSTTVRALRSHNQLFSIYIKGAFFTKQLQTKTQRDILKIQTRTLMMHSR